MDYQAFFTDLLAWIGQANQVAAQHGMNNPMFWQWVADSSAVICRKYNDHQLAVKMMMTMNEWLEDVHEGGRAAG